MLHYLSDTAAKTLSGWLRSDITDTDERTLAARPYQELDTDVARALGIEIVEGAPIILATDPTRRIGHLRIAAMGHNDVIAIDNIGWTGTCVGGLRILGSDCAIVLEDIGGLYVNFETMLLRSHGQIMFWGRGASAVGLSVELEGEGRSCVIGDDALISNGVWVRNYDMHAVHDLASGRQINRPPCDTVLERHVWLGQDALLLNCEWIGMGSIIGARALAKGVVPPHCIAAGTPARVLREGTSWGRSSSGMTAAERASIGLVNRSR